MMLYTLIDCQLSRNIIFDLSVRKKNVFLFSLTCETSSCIIPNIILKEKNGLYFNDHVGKMASF